MQTLHETAKDPGFHSWDTNLAPSPSGRLTLSAGSGLTQVRVSTSPEPRLWPQLKRSRKLAISGSCPRGAARPPSLALVREEPISALVTAREELLELTFGPTQAQVSASLEPILQLQRGRSCPPTISDSSPERVFRKEPPARREKFGADLRATQTRVSASPETLLWLLLWFCLFPSTPGAGQIAARLEFSPIILSWTTTAAPACREAALLTLGAGPRWTPGVGSPA
ncbi:hypothetical protein NDU88_004583 [Pleurodeles waltl]|uniref:Uncharacterized protein n=1 Tax=Pleurodeles waltl TaxID=8319 RepID=A0AAV7UG50_PLEWA|nr:hypothetical protein NDU88_004583 [Pleurodeles waltl]